MLYRGWVSKRTSRKSNTMSRKYPLRIGNPVFQMSLPGLDHWCSSSNSVGQVDSPTLPPNPSQKTVVLCRMSSPFLVESGNGWSVFLQQKIRLSRWQSRYVGQKYQERMGLWHRALRIGVSLNKESSSPQEQASSKA